MRAHSPRASIAAIAGLAIVGAVAGCSGSIVASRHHAHALAPLPSVAPTPTAVALSTPTPTASTSTKPKTVAKPPVTVHRAAPPPKPKPKPKPKPAPVTYKDGSYSALGHYQSPGGTETMKVTLTLASGVITALDVTSVQVDPTAAGYEADFEGGVNAVVVGRPISTLRVGAIGGSSLTSIGFNAAIATIRSEAKN